jgi:hypothetical protein
MQVHFPPQNEATFSFTEGVDWPFAKGGRECKGRSGLLQSTDSQKLGVFNLKYSAITWCEKVTF